MLLQFSDLFDETDLEADMMLELKQVYADEGVRMLWRLNEKIAVVKWQLGKGLLQEAMDICRCYCTEDSELSAWYISGIEFFTSAVKAVEKNPAGASELFHSVLVFLEFWDSAILSINKVWFRKLFLYANRLFLAILLQVTGKSKLSNASHFPSLPSMGADVEMEIRRVFGL